MAARPCHQLDPPYPEEQLKGHRGDFLALNEAYYRAALLEVHHRVLNKLP